jgi:hypothetical protein
MRGFMMTESDHLFRICNGTGMAMKWPLSQLTGFIIRVVNPSQRLLGVIDAGVVVLAFIQVLSVIHDADAVRRSARSESELVRRPTPLTGAGRRLVSHLRPPSRAAAEYGSIPEVAGAPAPGSALMSSLGRWPSLDRWLRRGRLALSA